MIAYSIRIPHWSSVITQPLTKNGELQIQIRIDSFG